MMKTGWKKDAERVGMEKKVEEGEVAVGMLQHATGTRHSKMPVPRPQDGQMERQTGQWGRQREGQTDRQWGQTKTDRQRRTVSVKVKVHLASQGELSCAEEKRGDPKRAASFLEPAGGFHYLTTTAAEAAATVAVVAVVAAVAAAFVVGAAAKLRDCCSICINYLPFTI